MKEVEIGGKSYKAKNTIRAMFVFEQIAKKKFEIKTTSDELVYMYSVLLANNPDMDMEFGAFLDAIDADPTVLQKFADALKEPTDGLFGDDSEDEGADGEAPKKA